MGEKFNQYFIRFPNHHNVLRHSTTNKLNQKGKKKDFVRLKSSFLSLFDPNRSVKWRRKSRAFNFCIKSVRSLYAQQHNWTIHDGMKRDFECSIVPEKKLIKMQHKLFICNGIIAQILSFCKLPIIRSRFLSCF